MRRLVPVVFVLFLLVCSATAQQRKPHKTPNQLRTDLSSIQQRKAALKRELARTRAAAHDVKVDLKQLDENLLGLEDALDKTQTSLADSRDEQVQLTNQLGVATHRVGVVKEQVRKRLRYMYMHRGESVVSAFIGVKTVGDIASRKIILESIAKKDHSLFDEYKDLQVRIKDRKHRQDLVVVRIQDLKERQLNYQAHLEVTKDEKGDALKSLQSKQSEIKGLLDQLEADEASVYAQIRAYEAAKAHNPKPGEPPAPVFLGRFLKPASGPIVSGFGMRYHPILHYTRLHAGIDIGAHAGSPIRAAGDGTVIAAQYSRSYGNMVIIDHGNGLSTLYAHSSRLMVHAGQVVKRGQVIAAVGSTGLASGPHLHWEVRVNGRPVNPMGRF